jgi:hypothetical protein
VTDLAAGDDWINDGNYGGTIDVRVRAADTAVFLDDAPIPCIARALRAPLPRRRFAGRRLVCRAPAA